MFAKRQSPSCNSQRYTAAVAVYDCFLTPSYRIDCQAQLSRTVGNINTVRAKKAVAAGTAA